jgi:hypothetical protein
MTMTVERAQEIVGKLDDVAFITWGLIRGPTPDLSGITLAEMVDACSIVREQETIEADGSRAMMAVPDDRLVAAIYAALHYDLQQEPIVIIGNKALVMDELSQALARRDGGA